MPAGTRSTVYLFALVAGLLTAPAASGQEFAAGAGAPPTARVGLDSVMSADTFLASDGHESGAAFDLAGAWRVAPRLEASARPVFSRGLDGQWEAEVYQLALRYDQPGRVRLRLEAGYLPSPIGIMVLESRADQNPLIAPATSYETRLPPLEAGTPPAQLSAGLYPLSAQATASTNRWDLRAGVLGSSPARVRPLRGEDKPPSAAQLALGGGVTPHIGLRLGASFSRGVYAKASEVADPSTGNRLATLMGLDADYSVGYTRVYADWIEGRFERAADTAVARTLTVTGVRTLSPRWYLAARVQRQSTSHAEFDADADSEAGWMASGPATALSLESVIGYRLMPELTVRTGYLGYRRFGVDEIEHHASCSIVWSQRWR